MGCFLFSQKLQGSGMGERYCRRFFGDRTDTKILCNILYLLILTTVLLIYMSTRSPKVQVYASRNFTNSTNNIRHESLFSLLKNSIQYPF